MVEYSTYSTILADRLVWVADCLTDGCVRCGYGYDSRDDRRCEAEDGEAHAG